LLTPLTSSLHQIGSIDYQQWTTGKLKHGSFGTDDNESCSKLVWAVYAAIEALSTSSRPEFRGLGDGWQKWLDFTKHTAARVFYNGTGRVCTVTSIASQSLSPTDPLQSYTCEGPDLLNDPYEGELFTWWLQLFGSLPKADKTALWLTKRPQLISTEYTGSNVNTSASDRSLTNYSGYPILPPTIPPITVARGLHFSSSEQFKLLMLPYLSIPLLSRIFHNAERARTCNAHLTANPGMFSRVINVSTEVSSSSSSFPPLLPAGIPILSTDLTQALDVITPSAIFPTLLFNTSIALAWYKSMLDLAPEAVQTPYGAAASLRRDASAVARFVGWDAKVPVVVALLGGVAGLVRRKMENERDGAVFAEFVTVADREYRRVFDPMRLLGEEVELCLPNVKGPGVEDGSRSGYGYGYGGY
jgi:hypothetical protein